MHSIREIRLGLKENQFHRELGRIYGDQAPRAAGRFLALLDGFCAFYGASEDRSACLFSTPGRTEIGGNHTDHQRGRTLAASVDIDTIACAAPNGENIIRIKSDGHRLAEITLDTLAPAAGEMGHSPALVRGVAARIAELGFPVGGFDAYTTTQVLRGGGLSSSATFEVLTATIINRLFCGGALSSAQLAEVGQYAENAYFGKPCGLMDQMACATGGVIALDFGAEGRPEVIRLPFDLAAAGYAMCIVDSGVSHAGLKAEYAAIPDEMLSVARFFGKGFLSEVSPGQFYQSLAALRESCGDRAVLRAHHFFIDDACARQECDAIASGDMDAFLSAVNRSGRSSYMYLQNVSTYRDPRDQGLAVLLAYAEELLQGRGACRVHGGGFAGTIQVFLPLRACQDFVAAMERLTGEGSCHLLSFRETGTCCVVS